MDPLPWKDPRVPTLGGFFAQDGILVRIVADDQVAEPVDRTGGCAGAERSEAQASEAAADRGRPGRRTTEERTRAVLDLLRG